MFDDELDVFYDEDDFAVLCTQSRPGENDVQFSGILAVTDESRFDGHVTAGVCVLRYPTAAAALAQEDTVRTQRKGEDGVLAPAEAWRVLRTPERVVDGAESEVYIKPDPEA